VTDLLLPQRLPAGFHRVDWNAAGVAGGSYIIRLQSGGESAEKRVTLVK